MPPNFTKALETVVTATTEETNSGDHEALDADLSRLREQLLVLGQAGSRLAALGRPEAFDLGEILNGDGASPAVVTHEPSSLVASLTAERRQEVDAAFEVSLISRSLSRFPHLNHSLSSSCV